jgi:hypothetical protein
VFEHQHQLVLTAVEGTHSGIVLDPHADVFELGIDPRAGGEQLAKVPPVHADEVNGAIAAVAGRKAAGCGQEARELSFVHLAASLRIRGGGLSSDRKRARRSARCRGDR